jgi:phenylalanyl-tRNA synthetase alpha chain
MPPIEIPELKDYSPASLDRFFSAVLAQFDQDAAEAASVEAMEQLRVRWIGRKQGLLTRVGEVLKGAPADARREVGKRFNALKAAIEPRCDPQQIRHHAPRHPARSRRRASPDPHHERDR